MWKAKQNILNLMNWLRCKSGFLIFPWGRFRGIKTYVLDISLYTSKLWTYTIFCGTLSEYVEKKKAVSHTFCGHKPFYFSTSFYLFLSLSYLFLIAVQLRKYEKKTKIIRVKLHMTVLHFMQYMSCKSNFLVSSNV